MAMDDLFAPEKSSSSGKIVILICLVLVVIIAGAGFAVYWKNRPVLKTAAEKKDESIRDATVMMLASRMFSGPDFGKQVLGNARLEWLNVKTREVYFSLPELSDPDHQTVLSTFLADQTKIDVAFEKSGVMRLGDISLTKTAGQNFFFKTPLDNIKIDPNLVLSFPFKRASYSLSLREMENFVNDSFIYGGKLNASVPQKSNGLLVFANHGSMVAKPGEPSLQRLTAELLSDPSIGDDRERKIQRLLDFVSNEIEYSYTEAVSPRETLKRADEVLFTRSADCSNKTILLASLLEQIGEDYILLYCPHHITVAVPRGNFPNDNKLDYTWEGKQWVIAEGTLPGFEIGKTRVKQYETLMTVEYVQRPKERDIIFDANSYRPLEFR